MTRPFDMSKFRTKLTKEIDGISIGFNDPTTWISTGSYALNKLVSGNFFGGIPLGRVTMFAGESGAGKSFIASGNIIKNAQEQGIFVVLIDTEAALDESWLKALGVDTSEEKLLKIGASQVDDVAKTIYGFVKEYKELSDAERENFKVLFVIDSLGMLMTPTEVDQFNKGDMKGDMGRKPKALKSLVTNLVNMFANHNIGLIATNHTYASQDMFDPDPKISGGSGPVYAASIVVAMRKLKLKEDENGVKGTDVLGIRAACKIVKTRYSKPFESIELQIPYETGMSPYTGLFSYFETRGVLVKSGSQYVYKAKNGEEFKMFRKDYIANKRGVLDLLMKENNTVDLQQLKEISEEVLEDITIEEEKKNDA